MEPRIRAEDFQHRKLVVTGTPTTLTCADGNDNVIFTEAIDYTDFPIEEARLYAVRGDGVCVVMLPSEY